MNADEIENLPAGYEINKLIAINAMGWALVNNHGAAGGKFWIGHGGSFGDIPESYLPDFSGDMNVAFSLVKKLEEHSNEILFSITRKGTTHGNLKWYARFRECLGYQKEFYAEAETAPLAICRAALLAVMPR